MATKSEESLAVVKAIYEAGQRGDGETMLKLIDENAHIETPPYWPWGAQYKTRDDWMNNTLPQLAEVFDLSSLRIDKLMADGDEVVAIVRTRVLESGEDSEELETWKVKDGKAVEMRVWVFDPRPVNDQIARVAARR